MSWIHVQVVVGMTHVLLWIHVQVVVGMTSCDVMGPCSSLCRLFGDMNTITNS